MTSSGQRIRVLLVEDSATDARLIESLAVRVPGPRLEITWAPNLEKAFARLELGNIDVVLLDLVLPDSAPEETIARMRTEVPSIPLVVWTSVEDEDFAAKALQAGAQDYLPKGRMDPELLGRTLRYAIERQRIRKDRERAYEELDEFAHIVSHDLKAPLRGIQNLAQILEEDLGKSAAPFVVETLAKLRDRAERLAHMVDGILAYSRRARIQGEATDFSVQGVVDEVLESVRPPEGFRVVATGLPKLHGDRLRFLEVVQNLVANAVKHHDRPAEGNLVITHRDVGERYEFTFQDDGPGIPLHERSRLFELFHPPSVRRAPDSTHVGLAIVRKIVESNGGAIEAEATQGRGARFVFTWPKQDGFAALGPTLSTGSKAPRRAS